MGGIKLPYYNAVWNLYYPLYCHLSKASEDLSRNSSERKRFQGMASRLASEAFVLNPGIIYDCLEELSGLSEDLQGRDITLTRAHCLIYRTIRVFHSMVDHPGIKYTKCLHRVLFEKLQDARYAR